MSKSKNELHKALRNKYLETVKAFLEAEGEEVLVTKSNEIAMPCVDEEGNEEYIVIIFKVPNGSRDGDPYDGHDEAKCYAETLADKAAKAQAKAEAKAKKIASDKAAREAKAKAKAEKGE